MKRSSSDIDPSPSPALSEGESEQSLSPSPTKAPLKKKAKSTKSPQASSPVKLETKSATTPRTPSKSKAPKVEGQAWTPDKKERCIDYIIDVGYKAADISALATELGLAETQIRNQLNKGRKGSLRDKAAKAARGD